MSDQKDTNSHSNLTYRNHEVVEGIYDTLFVVHKKTERVVAALFLVTEYLENSNPIRHKVRSLSVEVMSYITSKGHSELLQENSLTRLYSTRFLEIASLLEVAFLAEQISEMNFRIIGSEIEHLISLVDEKKKRAGLNPQTSKVGSFFERQTSGTAGSELSVSGKIRQRLFGRKKGTPSKSFRRTEVGVSSHRHMKDTVSSKAEKESRRDSIIKHLSNGKVMSVKDFHDVLNGVSDKTIQRELSALVLEGVLKREGERRWSKYSMANSAVSNPSPIQQGEGVTEGR